MKNNDTSSLNIAPESDRDAKGRLRPGHRAGGRPHGSTNARGRGYLDQLHARAPKAWAVIDQRLQENCTKTALFIMARLLPDSRTVEVPGTDAAAWAEAMAAGDLTVGEAQRAAAAIKAVADTEELRVLRERLDEIETILATRADNRSCRS